MRTRWWAALALVPLTVVDARAACPPRATWPSTAWADATAATAAARGPAIRALEEYAFTLEGADVDRKGRRTDGIVIVKGGRIVYERYARGYDAARPHLAWSVTKTVTSALAGIAVGQGRLDVNESVCRYRSFRNADICRVRVEDTLTFGTGLDWAESYENDLPRASSVGAMLYGVGRKDMAEFVAGHGFRAEPGSVCSYSSGDTVLASSVVGAVLKPAHGEAFAHRLLFDRLGMRRTTLARDAAGTFVGSSYWYATPRDMARFGYLYLNDGCWDGERVLPEGWVAKSTALSDAYKRGSENNDPEDRYGYAWYSNVAYPERGEGVPFPDVPGDMFAARGHWGQSIVVIPSLDVVIVRVADDRESGVTDFNELLKRAIEVAR